MTATATHWTLSPNADEFLPEEIHQLELGTMIVCENCHWPRKPDRACDKCPTDNRDQRREITAAAAPDSGPAGISR